jgi:hypothetical protein
MDFNWDDDWAHPWYHTCPCYEILENPRRDGDHYQPL